MAALKKLMEARNRLNNENLSKSGKNTFAKYTYFELSDFIPQTQKIFHELGLAGVVSYGKESATLTITCTEENDSVVIETPMSSAALKGCHDVQNLGAVQTYLRRYLWVTAMEIVEHDVLDSSMPENKKSAPKDAKVTVEQVEIMELLLSKANVKDYSQFCSIYKVDRLSDIKQSLFDDAVKRINKKIAIINRQNEDIPQ